MLSFIILCLLSNSVISQNCTKNLTLKIIDSHDSSLLSNASIYIDELKLELQTNLDGEVTFENLCDKTYSVQISHDRCQTIFTKINVKESFFKTIRLEHHLNELDEIILLTELNSKSKSVYENKVTKQTLEEYTNKSLGDVLKTIPGVSSINTGNSLAKPQINGLTVAGF